MFRALNPPQNGKKTTIGDTDFIRFYPEISYSMPYERIEPHIETAIRLHLEPVLGETLIEKLILANDKTAKAIKSACAYFSMYTGYTSLVSTVTNTGVQELSGANGHSIGLGKIKYSKMELLSLAYANLDSGLSKMALMTNVYHTDFQDFTEPLFPVLFESAQELDKYLNIQGSFTAFKALIRYLKQAEQNVWERWFQTDATGDVQHLRAIVPHLQSKIKAYVAYQALIDAIPQVSLFFEGDGFKIFSIGKSDENVAKSKEHFQLIANLKTDCEIKLAIATAAIEKAMGAIEQTRLRVLGTQDENGNYFGGVFICS
jgi:hypothetical protein